MKSPHFDFPVIDAHVHLYPDALAPKVVPMLATRFGNDPAFDGTLSGCRRAMAASGISMSVNLPVATRPDHVGHTNGFWKKYAKPTDGIASLAALHPSTPDAPNAVDEIAAAGFAGIKFHPEYQEFGFNDSLMDDIWVAMAERNLVAYLHAGGERVFEPPFRSSPSEIRALHRRFPKLKIAAAHLGGFGMWDETEETLVGEDVTLDLSHTFSGCRTSGSKESSATMAQDAFSSALTLRGRSSRAYLARSPNCRYQRATAAQYAAKTR